MDRTPKGLVSQTFREGTVQLQEVDKLPLLELTKRLS